MPEPRRALSRVGPLMSARLFPDQPEFASAAEELFVASLRGLQGRYAEAQALRHEAEAMLRRLKAAPLLHGFRGSESVDIGRLADIICRASELVSDLRHDISEMDINPLICTGARITAVDGLIVKAG